VKETTKGALASGSDTKVAVIGGSGYVGEELVRLLLRHPFADLAAVTSRQFAGKTLEEIFPRLSHHSKADELRFTAPDPAQLAQMAEVIFLALPHGFAADTVKPLLRSEARIVDLSADFRIRDPKTYMEFFWRRGSRICRDRDFSLPEILAAR
jgi:N-acetyl-gamma-glutamyl-phosphate reductase